MNFHLDGNALNSILPILIFIFWVIVSLFGNAKRKGKGPLGKPIPSPTQTEDSYSTSAGESSKKENPLEEIKRALETVLNEGQTVPQTNERTSEPTYSSESDDHYTDYDDEVAQEDQDIEAPKTLESAKPQHTTYYQTLENAEQKNPQRRSDNTLLNLVPSPSEQSSQFNYDEPIEALETQFSIDDVRNGIIWSEILRKPVSIRDEKDEILLSKE